MNQKQKTVIAIAVMAIAAMGLYPPVAISCGGYQYGWILQILLAPADPECAEKSPDGWWWELGTDRLLLQWGFVIVAAVLLVRVFKGPKVLELLKDYEGAAFRFTKYMAAGTEWPHDHCAGCWAKFGEGDAPDILHDAYVTSEGAGLIFVCAACFGKCRGALDFRAQPDLAGGFPG